MTENAPLPPSAYCPNPDVDCPGQGPDLEEQREEVTDDQGHVVGWVVSMACRVCGYRWDRS